jgi:hypothetical protein
MTIRVKIEVSKIGRDTISHFNIAHDRPGTGKSGGEAKPGRSAGFAVVGSVRREPYEGVETVCGPRRNQRSGSTFIWKNPAD